MRVAVLGGGAWGTALGAVATNDGAPVMLWAREPEVVAAINKTHRNDAFLPGIPLPTGLTATATLTDLAGAEVILLVCPAQHLRPVLTSLAPALKPGTVLVSCAKGIERITDALMTDIIAAAAPSTIPAVLSGPSFAEEVALGQPTAVTLAVADSSLGARLAARLGRPTFRPYLSDDLIGAQLGGAVKNVLAIACGIVEGRGLGHSAGAAVITRGFAEMTRFAVARGARLETLAGLSGLGDLVLTCTSAKSRNFSLGVGIGTGGAPVALAENRTSIAEGAFTAAALVDLAGRLGVEMPISAAVDGILTGRLTVDEAIDALLARPLKPEDPLSLGARN